MAEEGKLVQGAGQGLCPTPVFSSLPGPSMVVQSHFSHPEESSVFFHVSCFFSFQTGLDAKASAQAEPRAKVTGPCFHWVVLLGKWQKHRQKREEAREACSLRRGQGMSFPLASWEASGEPSGGGNGHGRGMLLSLSDRVSQMPGEGSQSAGRWNG